MSEESRAGSGCLAMGRLWGERVSLTRQMEWIGYGKSEVEDAGSVVEGREEIWRGRKLGRQIDMVIDMDKD